MINWAEPNEFKCESCGATAVGSIGLTTEGGAADVAPPGWRYRYLSNHRVWACGDDCQIKIGMLERFG